MANDAVEKILRIVMGQLGKQPEAAEASPDDQASQALELVRKAGQDIRQREAEYPERLQAVREARGTPEWLARLIPPAVMRASEAATAALFGAPEYPQELPGGPTPLPHPEQEKVADIVGQIAGTFGQFGVAEGLAGAALRALGRIPQAARAAEAFPSVVRAAGRGAATGAALTGIEELTSPEETDVRTLLQNIAFLGGAGAGGTLARQGLAAVRPGLPRLVEAPLTGAAAGAAGVLAEAPFTDEDLAEYLRTGAVDVAALALLHTVLTAITPQRPTADFRAKVRQALDAMRRGQEAARAGERVRVRSAQADYRAAVNEAYSEARRVNPSLPQQMPPEMRQRTDQAWQRATARPAPKDVTPPRPQQVTAGPGPAPAEPPAQPPAQAPALPPAQAPVPTVQEPRPPAPQQQPVAPPEPPAPRVPVAPPQRSIDVPGRAEPVARQQPVQGPPPAPPEAPEVPAPTPPRPQEPQEQPGAPDIPIPVSPDDIPFDRAKAAYLWNSMDPDLRARQAQQEYVEHIRQVYEELAPLARSPQQQEVLRQELEKYREQYRNRFLAILAARSRTANVMVTGPARFPTQRNQRALERERSLIEQFNAWHRKAMRAMRRAVEQAAPPEQRAADERRRVEVRVRADLATMQRIDQGDPDFRHLKRSYLARSLANYIRRLSPDDARFALNLVKEAQTGMKRPVFAKNNSIWRLLEEAPEEPKSTAEPPAPGRTGTEVIATFDGGQVVANYDNDRVQILFDEKPSQAVLNALKGAGWRWSRANKAWQRKDTANARASAQYILSQHYGETQVEPQRTAEPVSTHEPQPTPAPPRELAPVATGSTSRAATERGTEVETQWAVVEAADLITSHDTNLRVNPEFPQELQPRARERAASQLQINRMVAELRPEFLAESPKASEGAPIVGPDGVVESGNARTIALKRAYETRPESAQRYRTFLVENAQRFGLDPEAIRNAQAPVLVRVRRSDVDRRQFVIEANEASVAAMSPTEQAMADAERVTPAMMEAFDPGPDGEILAPSNRDFVSAFVKEIIGPAERGRYLTARGQLSQEGVNRIRNAVFARAYGDAEAVGQLAEATDSNVRNITAGMVMAAPRIAEIRDRIRAGQLFDLDPAAEVTAAMRKLSDLRSEGVAVETYLSQTSMFGDDLSALAKDFLAIFDKYKRSRKQIANVLRAYADVVEAAGHPQQATMFGAEEPPSKADVLQAAINKVEAGYEPATSAQAAFFGSGRAEGEAARAAAGRMARGEAGEAAATKAAEGNAPEVVAPGMVVVENPRFQSLEVHFDSQTPEAVKRILRRHGFVYSRSVRAWVGRHTEKNRQLTLEIANMLEASRIAETPAEEVVGAPSLPGPSATAVARRQRARVPAKAFKADVATKKDIIDAIERQFAVPIRTGRMKLKGYAGQYDVRQRVIRLKTSHDIITAAHELGHHIEKGLGINPLNYIELEKLGRQLYPRSGPGKQRKEGFAEFVALYIIDPAEAKRQVPDFFETFTATLDAVPEVREAFREVQRLYQRYLSADPVERVKAVITNDIPKEQPFLTTGERYWSLWAEQNHSIWKAQKLALGEDVKTEWDVDIAKNPFVLLGLAKGAGRVSTAWLVESQFSPDGKKIGPSLKEILEPVKESVANLDFQAYLVSRRIVEGLAERGIKTGISIRDARETVRRLETPAFKKAADQLYEYQDNLNNWLLWAEMVTPDGLQRMKHLDPAHVPFYRFFGDEPAAGQPRTTGRKVVDLPQAIKRMRGSERPILDPIISIMQNTRFYIDLAKRNYAMKTLAKLVDEAEGLGQWIEKLPQQYEADPVKLERLRDDLIEAGVPEEVLDEADLEHVAMIFNPLRFSRWKEKKENIATIWRKGKPTFYRLHPEIYRAAYGLDASAASFLLRVLSWPTRVMRAGNVLAPVFAMSNAARDLQTYLVLNRYSSGLAESVGALVKGLFHVMKKDDLYWDWVSSGGAQSTLTQISRDYLEKDLREMLNLRTRREKVWHTVRLPFTALEALGQAIEETPRVAQYILAKRKGVPREMGAYASRNVTIDFSRGGPYAKTVNQLKAFFNAAIQGNRNLFHNLRTRPEVWMRSVLYITLPSIILYLINRDDPRYQEMPRWKKDLFWVFFLGDYVVTIPKAHELGILFGTIPERIMEWIDTQDPSAFDDLLDTITTSALPGDPRLTSILDWMPTAVQPWIEATMGEGGWSAFLQGPIVPASEQDLPPEYQYGPDTTETAKAIGRALSVSPRKVEHVVRGYGGTLAMDVLEALDRLTGKSDRSIMDILFGTRFTHRAYQSALSVDDFYEELNRLETEYRGVREDYRRRGLDPDKYVQPPARLTELRRVQRQLADWRRHLRTIEESPNYTREQKKQYRDLVNLYMADLARRALGREPLLDAPHYAPGTSQAQRRSSVTTRPTLRLPVGLPAGQ